MWRAAVGEGGRAHVDGVGAVLVAAVVVAATLAGAGPAAAAGPPCGDVLVADTTLTADRGGHSLVSDGTHDAGVAVLGRASRTVISGNTISGHAEATGVFGIGISSRGPETEVSGNLLFGNGAGVVVSSGTVSGNLVVATPPVRRRGLLAVTSGAGQRTPDHPAS